jgi:hypothetical protein
MRIKKEKKSARIASKPMKKELEQIKTIPKTLSFHPKLKFKIINKNTPDSFVKEFEIALSKVSDRYFDDLSKDCAIYYSKVCHGDQDKAFLKAMRERTRGNIPMGQRFTPTREQIQQLRSVYLNDFCHYVFDVLSENVATHRMFPIFDFFMTSDDKRIITFKLQKLDEISIDEHQYYQSSYKFQSIFEGKPMFLLYTQHFIDRVTQRLSQGKTNWGGYSRVFEYLCNSCYFEQTKLQDGQKAIIIYNRAYPFGDVFGKVMLDIDKSLSGNPRKYYILGYVPVIENGDYLICKTILFPGMRNTPQYRLIKNGALSPEDKGIYLNSFEGISQAQVFDQSKTLEAYRWVHENGCSLTKHIDEDIFYFEEDECKLTQEELGKV